LDFIAENPHYKALLGHASFLQSTVNEARAQVTRLTEEVAQLRSSRKEWEDGVLVWFPTLMFILIADTALGFRKSSQSRIQGNVS
jgi:hypothetical protein